MTPLRDDLLEALHTEGRLTAADAAAIVRTTTKIARVALHALVDAGVVRLAKHARPRAGGSIAMTFEATP